MGRYRATARQKNCLLRAVSIAARPALRQWPLRSMVLSLAFAAVLGHRICHSIVPNVEDAWCDTSCNGKTQNCVAEFCECEPSLHCKSLSKAVSKLGSSCNNMRG